MLVSFSLSKNLIIKGILWELSNDGSEVLFHQEMMCGTGPSGQESIKKFKMCQTIIAYFLLVLSCFHTFCVIFVIKLILKTWMSSSVVGLTLFLASSSFIVLLPL